MISIHNLYSPLSPVSLFASLLGQSDNSQDSSMLVSNPPVSSGVKTSTTHDKVHKTSAFSSSSTVSSSHLPSLPPEIVRKIYGLVPSYESSLRRIIKEHFKIVEQSASHSDSAPVNTGSTNHRMKRCGPPQVGHGLSPMLYVDNIDNAFVYATIANRCCQGCLSPYNCGNPHYELKLHLFLNGEYVPFTKAHAFDAFSLPLSYQQSALQVIKTWKKTVIRVMKDLLMFPSFVNVGHIWWHLSHVSSPYWNCRCPELEEGMYLEEYCRQNPHWARDFILHHYCGEMFFEEMLEKYLEHPCSFKPLAAVFGAEVANRLLMASSMVNPRKKLKSSLSYHDIEMHSVIYSTDDEEAEEEEAENENGSNSVSSDNIGSSNGANDDEESEEEDDDDDDDEVDEDGFDILS